MTQPSGTSNAATDEITSPSLSVSGTQAPAQSGGVKESAAQVKDSAAQAGQQVAGTAKDQAREVLGETQRQTKDLLDQGRRELTHQASQQHQRAASGLRSISEELHAMATGSQQPGLATDLTREAAQRTQAIAGWLDQREPGDLIQEVKSFARQRPVAFLAIAAGAGLLAGRVGRGIQADASASHVDVPSTSGTPAYGTPTTYGTTSTYGTTNTYDATSTYGAADPMSDPLADPTGEPALGALGAPAGTGQLPTGDYRGMSGTAQITPDAAAAQVPPSRPGEHR